MKEKYDFDAISFGMRLSEIRNFYEMTQAAVAEKLDVSDKSVQNWERGEKLPGIDNIVALAKLYSMSIGEILEDEPYRIFKKKFDSRKRSIEIVAVEGKLDFFMEFTEDRFFNRYEAWVWDEGAPYKYQCCTTDKIASYDLFKKSMLDDADSIATSYREWLFSALDESEADKSFKVQLQNKIKAEQAGMAAPNAVFVNNIVHYFDDGE